MKKHQNIKLKKWTSVIGTNVYNVHVPKSKKVQNKSRNEETIDKCPTDGNKCLKKRKKEWNGIAKSKKKGGKSKIVNAAS